MNKEILQATAFEINDLLNEYIMVHNQILKNAGSFLSFFRRVNFKELYADTEVILLKFNSISEKVALLKAELYDDLPQNQKLFFDCLSDYIDALTRTVDALHTKVNLLYQRSQNKNSLSFKELQSADKDYQNCINNYMKIGNRLNELYGQI
jgi:hypothetical protein